MPKSLQILGHRGARGLITENSLQGFTQTLAMGVHALELDVHISRDGVVVVHHDASLNTDITRDSQGLRLDAVTPTIYELDFELLQQYQLCSPRPGSDYAQQFPQQQGGTSQRIPRLEQIIELLKVPGYQQVELVIELKLDARKPHQGLAAESFCDTVVDVLRRENMLQRCYLQSFDWKAILHAQHKHPEVRCAFLSVQRREWNNIDALDGLDSPWTCGFKIKDHNFNLPEMIHAAGGRIWAPDYHQLAAEQITAAQALGMRVVAWTVNKPADMLRLMEFGIDGIITDYPDRLRVLMEQHGYELPGANTTGATSSKLEMFA